MERLGSVVRSDAHPLCVSFKSPLGLSVLRNWFYCWSNEKFNDDLRDGFHASINKAKPIEKHTLNIIFLPPK